MKILIIGSKGFIGSHCVSYFTKTHNVWECDVVTDYVNKNYFIVDATNADYNAVFDKRQFDICINCSGAASVPDSIKNPQRDFLLNVVNVFSQLNAIKNHQTSCKYINLSSAAVYGNPEYLPIDENHPLQPISPYGVHKKLSEDICKSFFENYNIPTCSLRIFSAFGNGLKKQLFWDLHLKAQNNTVVKLFGTGEESRDFIHVKDVVQAINLVIKNADFKNDVINVANGKELMIKDIAKTFYDIYKHEVKFTFQNKERKGDPSNWVADISKLMALGFTANVEVNKGLNSYVEWLRENE
jgi:UDP-glucose 4-epimerase